MNAQSEIQLLLNAHLSQEKKQNPSFSLRELARQLNLSSSALSEICNGKRRVSQKMAMRICEGLELSPVEAERIKNAFSQAPKMSGARNAQMLKRMDHYHIFNDSEHLKLLAWGEGRVSFGLQAQEFKKEKHRLHRCGFLEQCAPEEWRVTRKGLELLKSMNFSKIYVRSSKKKQEQLVFRLSEIKKELRDLLYDSKGEDLVELELSSRAIIKKTPQ